MKQHLNDQLFKSKGYDGPGPTGIKSTVIPPDNSLWNPPAEIQAAADWLKNQNKG